MNWATRPSRRRLMIRSLALLTGIFVLCLLAGTALAQSVHNVSSIAQLQTAINRAIPGDQIILKNGSYTTSGAITVARAGVAGKPITIAAQTIRGATIKGAGMVIGLPATPA